MAKNKEKEKKHNGGFITVIVLLAVILAALAGIAVLSTLGYFGGSSSKDESSNVDESTKVDESSDVEESDTTTDSSEDEGESHTHTYEFSYVAPTCTEQGYIIMTCTECGESYKEAVPATGHSFETGEITREATCTEDAVVSFACSVCGETYSIVVSGTALGHDYSVIVNSAELGIHYTVCSRCDEYEEDSASLCTYEENKYACDEDGKLHGVCDVCGGLSVNTIVTLPASDDGSYAFDVNSEAGLTNALEALTNAERDSNAEPSTITLTGDLTLDEGETASEFEISVSNVILDGGEDGCTLSSGHEIDVSGDNVTIKNITIDGSSTKSDLETYAHAIKITGDDVTLENCTIIGGEAATYTSAVLIEADTSSNDEREVEIKGCDITGAFRGVYINKAGDVDLYVSDSYLESVYSFNKTGNSNGSLYFENSTLMGWTSYAQSKEVIFTGCTFGFNDDPSQCYGFLRGYSDATFTDCLFRSFVSRQAETENTLTNGCSGEEPIGHDNYMLGVGASSVVYTLLDCSFEHVCDTEGSTDYSVETLTAENAGYLMSTDYGEDAYKSTCGFKFSTEEEAKLYTYLCYSSSLFNNN